MGQLLAPVWHDGGTGSPRWVGNSKAGVFDADAGTCHWRTSSRFVIDSIDADGNDVDTYVEQTIQLATGPVVIDNDVGYTSVWTIVSYGTSTDRWVQLSGGMDESEWNTYYVGKNVLIYPQGVV